MRPYWWLVVGVLACNESSFKGGSDRVAGRQTREFVQASYPAQEKRFVQGRAGESRQQAFDQGSWGPLDVLVVVDTSSSMAEEQRNLSTKLDPLLSHVAAADWRVAVVTTDNADPCQRALVRKGEADASARFQNAINAGTGGSGIERGIARAVAGLQCQGGSWLRADSSLAVLIVSDEDNCHIGDADDANYGCQGEPGRYSEHLMQYLSSIRKPGQDARVYGLLWDPAALPSECPSALNRGHAYAEVAKATGGQVGSICSDDYTATLRKISEDVAKILKVSFTLDAVPDAGSLQVLVNGQASDRFTVSGKTVSFTEPPPFGAKIEARYRVGGSGQVLTAATLDKPAASESLKVQINGQELGKDAYSYEPGGGQILFKNKPEDGAEVVISYQELSQLPAAFTLDVDAEPASIQVLVDGNPAKASYDAARRAVLVEPYPPPGAKVVISFQQKK